MVHIIKFTLLLAHFYGPVPFIGLQSVSSLIARELTSYALLEFYLGKF